MEADRGYITVLAALNVIPPHIIATSLIGLLLKPPERNGSDAGAWLWPRRTQGFLHTGPGSYGDGEDSIYNAYPRRHGLPSLV